MTTPHRTLQMALDALDAITDDVDGTGLNTMPSFDKAIDAITALREALAAPQPEPVAYVPRCHTDGNYCIVGEYKWDEIEEKPFGLADPAHWECAALYAAAPPAAPDIVNPITPAGMVMVPREPTEAMCISGDKARHSVVTQARTSAIYRAMIAAAPAPAVPVSWDRLRVLMDGIPTREEFIGGQRQKYVAKEAVMSWLHEGQLRAKREAVQPAAPTVQVVLRQPNLFASAPAVREPKDTETSRLLANVADAARRLVEHADFQLGGILSADSKAKEIPSKAVSQVKARHLASLRDRVAELDAAHGIGGGGK